MSWRPLECTTNERVLPFPDKSSTNLHLPEGRKLLTREIPEPRTPPSNACNSRRHIHHATTHSPVFYRFNTKPFTCETNPILKRAGLLNGTLRVYRCNRTLFVTHRLPLSHNNHSCRRRESNYAREAPQWENSILRALTSPSPTITFELRFLSLCTCFIYHQLYSCTFHKQIK